MITWTKKISSLLLLLISSEIALVASPWLGPELILARHFKFLEARNKDPTTTGSRRFRPTVNILLVLLEILSVEVEVSCATRHFFAIATTNGHLILFFFCHSNELPY